MTPPTVLILDDAHDSRLLLETFLDRHGFRVLSAADGATGLRLASEHRPAIVITDILMPGLSGFRVVDLLRRETNYQPRIVVISAMDAPLHRAYAAALGVDEYLAKPFPLRQLAEVLDRLAPPADLVSEPGELDEGAVDVLVRV
jgi:DNA-binding response OmpR family regulator